MHKKYFIAIICMFLFGKVKSQDLPEIQRLEDIISDYFENSRNILELEAIGKLGRPDEAFFLILDIDSFGSVKTVHLFTEEAKDSGYAIIKNLKPADFKSWKEEEYKLRSIVIPVVVFSSPTRNYVYYLADMTSQRRAIRKIVVGKTVRLGWPVIKGHEATQSIPVN